MVDYLLKEPDALALVLFLVIVSTALIIGLVKAVRQDRRRDTLEENNLQKEKPSALKDPPSGRELVTVWPHLLKRELFAAMLVCLILSWWAIIHEFPLGAPVDPQVTPTVAKAPWFFIGIQELLQYFDAWIAGVLLPLITILGLMALPYLDVSQEGVGQHTIKKRPLAISGLLLLFGFWLCPAVIGLYLRTENWSLGPAWRGAPIAESETFLYTSFAERFGLSSIANQILGGALCLGPFLALFAIWPRVKKRPWAKRMGFGRYFVATGLAVLACGVLLKILLQLALKVRYIWITPWFRI